MAARASIRITGIVDGDIRASTKGGALREIPFQLSAEPDPDWEGYCIGIGISPLSGRPHTGLVSRESKLIV